MPELGLCANLFFKVERGSLYVRADRGLLPACRRPRPVSRGAARRGSGRPSGRGGASAGLKADNAQGRAFSGAQSMTASGPGQRPGLPAKRGRGARLDPCTASESKMAPHLLENTRNRLGNGRPHSELDPGDQDEVLVMARLGRRRWPGNRPQTPGRAFDKPRVQAQGGQQLVDRSVCRQ